MMSLLPLVGALALQAPGFVLESPGLAPGASFPVTATCDGTNTSPALAWRDAPAGTQSFAVVLLDPDHTPPPAFTHWALFDVPASTTSLPEGSSPGALPAGALEAKNDYAGTGAPFAQAAYAGPCPPPGAIHRYRFTVTALDVAHLEPVPATPAALAAAIATHKLAEATLELPFERARRTWLLGFGVAGAILIGALLVVVVRMATRGRRPKTGATIP
jgi:Raf kinase inhibitor-like YbhB/YbcL family protein